MIKPNLKIAFLFVLIILLSIQGSISLDRQSISQESSQKLSLNPDFGNIRLYFIPNEGQVDKRALFYARASRYTLWLTQEGLIFDSSRKTESGVKEYGDKVKLGKLEMLSRKAEPEKYERDVSRLIFLHANENPEMVPLDLTEHRVNYFIGGDKDKWKSNISTSKVVLYKNLYKNIDLKVYGAERQIEYDWIVKPGGNPEEITFIYKDVKATKIDDERNLLVETLFGQLLHKKPLSYQVIDGERMEVDVSFRPIGKDTYGFKVNAYEKDYDLIIDPLVLTYSTYLGGSSNDWSYEIVVDSSGNAYVTGETESPDFPTQNAFQSIHKGSFDVFVIKLLSTGSSLVYSTYLGGGDIDEGSDIAVDSSGNVYITGTTLSPDFPTQNAFQAEYQGEWDAFVTKLSSTGSSLVYSTYLGGNSADPGYGIAVDSSGNAYVTGGTGSPDFPIQHPYQTDQGEWDAFVTKLSSKGNSLVYSTYLGGGDNDEGREIAVDISGNTYIIGYTESTDFPTKNAFQADSQGSSDVFVTKLSSKGRSLDYSTYLGGFHVDDGVDIAIDSSGNAYVTGITRSPDFPTQNAFQAEYQGERDAFVTKLSSTGNSLVYSTYLGGGASDLGLDIAVDSSGNAYVTGWTESTDFPTQYPYQTDQGEWDAFVTKLSSKGSSLVYSTYLGGNLRDWCEGIAVDSSGNAYVTGRTESTDFPIQYPYQTDQGEWDAFIAKIALAEGIRVVSWNILDYPDMNEEPRDEYFRSILELLNPDILVVQEMASAAGVSQFLKEVLNPKKPNLYKAASFFDGPDTDSALFYKKAMFKVVSRQQIPTLYRDITEYEMIIKKGKGKGTKFKVYSLHFSEGAGAKKKRENEAITLRNYLDGLLPDELFLVCGTFNMLSSTEKAFKILTSNQVNNNGRLMDPIHKSGKWRDNSKHKRFHTESTRESKFGGGTGGGLDDRFDMILISYGLDENERLIYLDGSYSVFGNDGEHLNKAINKPENKVVSSDIADALCMASDHLPVIIEFVSEDEFK
jgi:endonuclease/exonuclease/phosphatase family metal-dependent hydrolase